MYSDKNGFSKDPFGYSALAWQKWGTLATANGFTIDITKPPTVADLKNPVLWLSHANALSEAAVCLVQSPQTFKSMPPGINVKETSSWASGNLATESHRIRNS